MNLPNRISLARICLIPLVVFFYLANFIPWGKLIATVIFVVACLTDFVDGKIARKRNLVTNLGKFLDSIADKILTMTGLILIVATPVVSPFTGNSGPIVGIDWVGIVCAIIILAREFMISALRQIAATKGKVLAAEQSGRIKAAFQMVTLSLYFVYAFLFTEIFTNTESIKTVNAIIGITLVIMLAISTLLTITSGIGYLVRNKAVFAEDKPEEKVEIIVEQVPVMEEAVEDAPKTEQKETTTRKTTTTAKKKTPARRSPVKKAPEKPSALVAPPAQQESKQKDSRGRPIDLLIPQALELFWEKGWASTTMLQKHLGVGYPRASKMVDQMEELGLISSNEGAKTRLVLVTKEEFEKNNKIF